MLIRLVSIDRLAQELGYSRANSAYGDWPATLWIKPVADHRGCWPIRAGRSAVRSDKDTPIALDLRMQALLHLPHLWVKATNTPAIHQSSNRLLPVARQIRNEIKTEQPEEAIPVEDQGSAVADNERVRSGD